MIETEIIDGELPYRIKIDGLYGAGDTPSRAAMAALSVGGHIPAGMRDRWGVAMYVFWHYEANPSWVQLIRILWRDSFEKIGGE